MSNSKGRHLRWLVKVHHIDGLWLKECSLVIVRSIGKTVRYLYEGVSIEGKVL